jgi:hypothetical protein
MPQIQTIAVTPQIQAALCQGVVPAPDSLFALIVESHGITAESRFLGQNPQGVESTEMAGGSRGAVPVSCGLN